MGSVTDELIRKVTAPTLVVPVHDEESPRSDAPFRHVLITVDSTPDSEGVLTPAMELARLSGAAVTLLRVVEPNKPVTKSTQPPPVTEFHLGAERGHTAEAELDRLTATLRGHKLNAEARIIDSDRPEEAIIDEAKRLNCDLIALETHGRSGLNRLFRGSVTDKVLRAAPCSVLVHRSDHRSHKGESSMHSDDLVSVFQAPDAVLARIVAADLANEGIACRVSGDNQGGFMGVGAMSVDVLVHADDFDRARKIIREGEPHRGKKAEEEE
jgi:nucleotide-binding universal stress UspA family protein